MEESHVERFEEGGQQSVCLLSGCGSWQVLYVEIVGWVEGLVRFFYLRGGSWLMAGYSMYLGFQTSRTCFLTLMTATDLIWYCRK